ncbi:MAG: DNA-3-methyladenine glycosylase, partial [Caldimonas sp.]
PAGHGAGVLIRALEPTAGVALMRERRSLSDRRLLCAGPGRLCQALAVTRAHDGCRLDRAPFRLTPRIGPVPAIGVGQRIGLTRARDVPWRFVLEGSPFLSRSMPRAAVHTGRP